MTPPSAHLTAPATLPHRPHTGPNTGPHTGPGARGALRVHRRVAHLMGMPISLALRGRHAIDQRAKVAWAVALDNLEQVDRVFSTYRPDSHISRLNRGDISLDDCPSEVADVLALGEQARVESDGAFDVRHRDPHGNLVLDPSGVVKGWAVQRAARAFDPLPDTDFCLSAGGDMVCRVTDPDRPAWQIGIEDPHTSNRIVAVIPIRHGAVATSALTHRGAHIIDARTGQAPTGVASVTVIADDLTWADIDATAAFAHGHHALRWLTTRPARQGLVIWDNGTPEIYHTQSA
jgi:thiamine biosynthesis lipoprotein